MERFEGASRSDAFVRLMAGHPDGDWYVLNYRIPASPQYLVLHRTTCPDLGRSIREKECMTDPYGKLCSSNLAELEREGERIGARPHFCMKCFPANKDISRSRVR